MTESQKQCRKCGQVKSERSWTPSAFVKAGGWCKECRTAYNRARHRAKYQPSRDSRHYPQTAEGEQFCGRCRTVKPIGEFASSQHSRKGTCWCKTCYRDWHRERYTPKGDATDEPRECAQCGVVYQPKTRRTSKYCSFACGDQHRKESGHTRNAHLLRKYGITADDYDRLLVAQGGGCALCGIKPEELTTGRYQTYLHVDHDHETNAVRGLLCPDHNLLLGRFGDNVEMFRRVVEYLEAHAS